MLFSQFNNINEKTHHFHSKIHNIFEKNIPSKDVIIRPNDKPWINQELRKQIRKRNRLRKKFLHKRNQYALQKYRKIRNKVNPQIGNPAETCLKPHHVSGRFPHC